MVTLRLVLLTAAGCGESQLLASAAVIVLAPPFTPCAAGFLLIKNCFVPVTWSP
jgi:hypothetical protein